MKSIFCRLGIFAFLLGCFSAQGALAQEVSSPNDGVVSYGKGPGKTQVLIIGVDGLEPSVVNRFLHKGKLPSIKRLLERGARTAVDCQVGMSSPVVWTSIATGVRPEVHGITGFIMDGLPVTSNLRTVPAFWNILDSAGISVATLGWMVTWPAEKNGGIIISDRAFWGKFSDKAFPVDAIDLTPYQYNGVPNLDFVPKFTNYPYNPNFEELPKEDPAYSVNFLIKRRFIDIYVRDNIYFNMAMEVLEKHSPTVMAVYFQGVDYTSHGFWQWFEPKPFADAGWKINSKEVSQLKDVIPRYYEYTDSLIGKLLDKVDSDTLVVLVADHGFGPRPDLSVPSIGVKIQGEQPNLGDFISGNHRDKTMLIMSGPQIDSTAKAGTMVTHLDILPTLLYTLGLELPKNLPGRPLKEFFIPGFKSLEHFQKAKKLDADKQKENAPVRSEHDKEILEELRSLGYIR